MSQFELAQINIAKAVDSLESETMSGFVSRLDEINLLAEKSPGFVWRLQTEDGDATSIQAYDDPNIIVNMSVWQDLESLKNFVYRSIHVDLIRDREAWFSKLASAHQALWWVPVGHRPDVAEGLAKLELLDEKGPGPDAFIFAKPQPHPIS